MEKLHCFDFSKQKVLGILDTEFNQSNKILGKDAINLAIKDNSITPEQFAIKHIAAIDQVVSKRYMIDYHKSKRNVFASIVQTSQDTMTE